MALALIAMTFASGGHAGHSPTPAAAIAPALGVDECIQVNSGDTFAVTISVSGVTNLLAWDVYYAYDRSILEVVGRDVRQFLDEEPNSNMFDLSDPLPNTTGFYRIGAADTGGPGTEEDGGGVLAKLTLRARGEGVSWSSLGPFDANADGVADLGPTLTQSGGGHIGDSDGDGIFDGPSRAGRIAVGRPCSGPLPTPFIDDSILINSSIKTPRLTPRAPTPRPDGSTPPPGDTAATSASSSPTMGSGLSSTPSGSLIPTEGGGSSRRSGSDGASSGLSPLIAVLLGVGGGAGILASYLLFRAVRRPV